MSLKGLFNARWPGVALFDLDGTLVDSAPDLAAAVDQMLAHMPKEKITRWNPSKSRNILLSDAILTKTFENIYEILKARIKKFLAKTMNFSTK